jgi:hypothetical protein
MAKRQPDQVAKILGHAIVGIGVAYVAKQVVVKAVPPAIFLGVMAIIIHDVFDAPVSQALGEMGV